ncbi:MAG: GtrA family protein [Gaiellaceae bacterium]
MIERLRSFATRERIIQFALFLVVGGISAGIDAGGFIVLTTLGLSPLVASPISFLASFGFNFFANRILVFRAPHERWQIVRYTTLVAVNTGVSTLLVAGGIALGLPPLAAKLISMGLIAMWNFVLLRVWVFRPSKAARLLAQQARATAEGTPKSV